MKKIYFEIPLEIQLYNIINFTPCPLNNDLQIELFANMDLITLKKQSNKELSSYSKIKKENNGEKDEMQVTKEKIVLQQLSGYPYFDIDLSYLFHHFTFEKFFIAYIFFFS